MPVVVTGADQPLGLAVVGALLAAGATEVRATVRDRAAVPGLVGRGVRTAVSDLVDPLRFGAVLEGAHTVIHLDGGHPGGSHSAGAVAGATREADRDPAGTGPGGEPTGSWDLLLEAAEDTGVRRLVTVCRPGVDPPPCPYHLIVVRAPSYRPEPELVAALVEADRRRYGHGVEVVDLPGRPPGRGAQ